MDDDSLVIKPDAAEAYNEWRAKKLAGMVDLSIEAYNREVLTLQAVWEMGRKAGVAGKNASDSPYLSQVR